MAHWIQKKNPQKKHHARAPRKAAAAPMSRPLARRVQAANAHAARRRNAGGGYVDCACRDCFEIAIADTDKDAPNALCHECRDAGCTPNNGECRRENTYDDVEENPRKRPRKRATRNPGLSPAEAKKRYKRDHWGQRGNEQVKTAKAPDPAFGVLVELGELVSIVYKTRKGADGAAGVEYEHDFAEGKSGIRPRLAYNRTGLVIVGGSYHVSERGIVG